MKDDKKVQVPPGVDVETPVPFEGDASGATNVSRAGHDATEKSAAVDVQSYIGRQLRAIYDDVANQPVPDRFLTLMKQLDGK